MIEVMPGNQQCGLETGRRVKVLPRHGRYLGQVAVCRGFVQLMPSLMPELQLVLCQRFGGKVAEHLADFGFDASMYLTFAVGLVEKVMIFSQQPVDQREAVTGLIGFEQLLCLFQIAQHLAVDREQHEVFVFGGDIGSTESARREREHAVAVEEPVEPPSALLRQPSLHL